MSIIAETNVFIVVILMILPSVITISISIVIVKGMVIFIPIVTFKNVIIYEMKPHVGI